MLIRSTVSIRLIAREMSKLLSERRREDSSANRRPAYFDAAAERDDYDEDEERRGGNDQLQQQRVHRQVVVVTDRALIAHQLQRLVCQLACIARVQRPLNDTFNNSGV